MPNDLRPALSALAPLRFYRLEALRYMLVSKNGDKVQPDGYYLGVLRNLAQTEVVWWDRAKKAYVTGEIIRKLINRRMWLEPNRELFLIQHRKAVEMYWEWAYRFSEACEDFIIELWFHQANIWGEGDEAKLRLEVDEAFDFAQKHLPIERQDTLYQQVKSDTELLDLLPEALRDELPERINPYKVLTQ
jgi:hypothetical protein